MNKTSVVNIRRNEYDIYIGRPRKGSMDDGYFGNPFSITSDGGRSNAIELFRSYFVQRINNDTEFATKIESLRGKTLGCFCKPKLCHGDVIADYLDRKMKVVVCGSRKWLNIEIIKKRLTKLSCNAIVIEGGCEGADLMARNIALDVGLEIVEFPAAWKKYGNSAGPIRNIKMLDTRPELVIAFHNDIQNSKGTKHIVGEARKRGIPTEVIRSII